MPEGKCRYSVVGVSYPGVALNGASSAWDVRVNGVAVGRIFQYGRLYAAEHMHGGGEAGHESKQAAIDRILQGRIGQR